MSRSEADVNRDCLNNRTVQLSILAFELDESKAIARQWHVTVSDSLEEFLLKPPVRIVPNGGEVKPFRFGFGLHFLGRVF